MDLVDRAKTSSPSSTHRTEVRRSRFKLRFSHFFYTFSAAFAVWLFASVLVHLYGSKDIRQQRPAISPRADNPAELYRCWESFYALFDELVYDFGHEVLLMRKHDRDLKTIWGERYGWDLLPLSQLPPDARGKEQAGSWRRRLMRVWSWCRLDEEQVVERSQILFLLREVYTALDRLRLNLTRRIRSFAGGKRFTLDGGTQSLIAEIRSKLLRARKLSIRLLRARGHTPDLSKLRRWRLKKKGSRK